MKKVVAIVLFALCLGFVAKAQELQCDVRVNASQVSGSDRTIYQNMQTALNEFINNTKFTDINFRQQEKIECSILIDVKSRDGEYFTADINIALRRPVYKSNYNSPMFNYIDRKFNFQYMDGMTLDFNPNTYVTDLTHTVGFYVYLMLGLDFDSFAPLGGSIFYDIAEQIVNSAPQTDDQPGWSTSGRSNRYTIISDINNPSYLSMRQFLYDYHRMGLDVMSEHPDEGREAMLAALANLQTVYERNSMCYFLQLIVESKRDEIIQAFSQGNMKIRTEAANIMKTIDPSMSSRYDAMLQDKGM